MYRMLYAFMICVALATHPQSCRAGEASTLGTCWSNFWARAQATKSNWKDSCRNCTKNWYQDQAQPTYGLRMLAGPYPSRHSVVVVFVHGYNSRPEDLEVLVDQIQRAGYRCASFRYPNDQSLVESAKLLSSSLGEQTCDVSIVAHSMGGLIAREAIENPGFDPGNVMRLIMITPPNHGSGLARVAHSMDVVEYVTSERRRKESGFIYGSIIDGLAEATDDMSPDSKFLTQLNSRPRNENVSYTILLGSDAPWDPNAFKRTRRCVSRLGERCSWVRTASRSIKSRLPELDELIAGRGDGIVSIKRGKLAGVDDVIVGDFDHNNILSDTPTPAARKARLQILARLGD